MYEALLKIFHLFTKNKTKLTFTVVAINYCQNLRCLHYYDDSYSVFTNEMQIFSEVCQKRSSVLEGVKLAWDQYVHNKAASVTIILEKY